VNPARKAEFFQKLILRISRIKTAESTGNDDPA